MAAWGLLHSLLATSTSKRLAAQALGEQRRNGFYRVGYNAIAIAATAGTALYIHKLPDRRLYQLQGRARVSARLTQLALLSLMLAAATEVGVGPFSGLTELIRYFYRKQTPDAPEAQGPSLGENGLRTGGPFRYVRHPLNAGATALVFLTPEMTVVRLTVALTTLLYALAGSRLEERRLLVRYGEAYRSYLQSGVPFFLPSLRPLYPARGR